MNSKLAVRQLKEVEKLIPDDVGRLAAEGWREKWKILIATILSSQTRDTKTIPICEKLFSKFNSAQKLGNAPLSEIKKIIRPINYYKTKAKNIKKTASVIADSGIPNSFGDLLELPGVGRKVANVYLVAAEDAEAIGVDTHVARISQKMGWTKNKNRHKIEKDLEKLFPKKYWNSINWILVRFGQSVGRSRGEEDVVLERLKKKIHI